MIGFDEASAIIAQLPDRMPVEQVLLAGASGRVLAADVIARLDSPRFDVSTMDGYAVRESDLANLPQELRVLAESFPGTPPIQSIADRGCVRIFTGAPVPAGFDRVVMQEAVRRDGEMAAFEQPLSSPRYIRRQGSDFHRGDVLLPAGTQLGARSLVAVAAADAAAVDVFRRPRVMIIATGDELAEPGAANGIPSAIPDSVSIGIAVFAEQWGAQCVDRKLLPDDLAELERAAKQSIASADLVVVTGGASAGEKDHGKAMFEPFGLEILFSRVAIKPGKPVWLGRAAGKLVLGLPGNPTSALVTARLFLAPLLLRLSGADPGNALRWRRAPLAAPAPACGDRETFARARWSGDGVEPLSDQDSGAQRALALADVLVRRRIEAPALGAGELVSIIDF